MSTYHFRRVTETDLPLIAHWRNAPHVSAWWAQSSVDQDRAALSDPRISMWIVTLDGRPFAFAQDYDVHGWQPHPFSYLPAGARGIDQFIGDANLINCGHGSAFIRQHVARLFSEGAPVVGTDPHPQNARALRAYDKAGFTRASQPMDTPWGPALLMERWQSPQHAHDTIAS